MSKNFKHIEVLVIWVTVLLFIHLSHVKFRIWLILLKICYLLNGGVFPIKVWEMLAYNVGNVVGVGELETLPPKLKEIRLPFEF